MLMNKCLRHLKEQKWGFISLLTLKIEMIKTKGIAFISLGKNRNTYKKAFFSLKTLTVYLPVNTTVTCHMTNKFNAKHGHLQNI